MSAAPYNQVHDVSRAAGPCPVIETARLKLRPHRLDDAEAIAASFRDFSIARMLRRVPMPYYKQDALEWLLPRVAAVLPDWTFAVTTPDDHHIGVVSLELRKGIWYLGYWLDSGHWGKGYMTEAVSAAVGRLVSQLPDIAVHSGFFADNRASLRVQEKLGFHLTGCSDVYSTARQAMVLHIDTVLEAGDFRPASRP